MPSYSPNYGGQLASLNPPHELATLFASGELGVCLDPRPSLGTMWQDVAKTTPVTATGQSVLAWEDAFGGGIEFINDVTANVPTLEVDGNGVYYLDFIGADQLYLAGGALDFSSLSFFANTRVTVGADLIIGRKQSTPNTSPFFRWNLYTASANRYEARLNGASQLSDSGDMPRNVWRSIGVVAPTGRYYSNKVARTRTAYPTMTYPSMSDVVIGSDFTGRIYGLVVINRALTVPEIEMVYDWQFST